MNKYLTPHGMITQVIYPNRPSLFTYLIRWIGKGDKEGDLTVEYVRAYTAKEAMAITSCEYGVAEKEIIEVRIEVINNALWS